MEREHARPRSRGYRSDPLRNTRKVIVCRRRAGTLLIRPQSGSYESSSLDMGWVKREASRSMSCIEGAANPASTPCSRGRCLGPSILRNWVKESRRLSRIGDASLSFCEDRVSSLAPILRGVTHMPNVHVRSSLSGTGCARLCFTPASGSTVISSEERSPCPTEAWCSQRATSSRSRTKL